MPLEFESSLFWNKGGNSNDDDIEGFCPAPIEVIDGAFDRWCKVTRR